ncbi:MAG: hypothetical protein CMN77_15670 [Spirochaetaceae bacterium]|nr:hypothetical protein [Spirochaetaceae bacterium]|tara:strand:- start:285906 stop:287816 length:1911 start_codon:yes stop_codon:yes gene_type:complete
MNRTLLQRLYLWIPGTLALVWAIYESIRIRWIADDAFISFRYALNLIRGHGLVFNAGEHVEGFTNFLWTILVALGLKMQISAELFSTVLSIGCFLFLLAFLLKRGAEQPSSDRDSMKSARSAPAKAVDMSSQTAPAINADLSSESGSRNRDMTPVFAAENSQFEELQSGQGSGPSGLPHFFALLILAGMHHMHVFATSGLETMAFAVFLFSGIYSVWIRQERNIAGLWFLTVACLLRPDGVIVLTVAWVYMAGDRIIFWKRHRKAAHATSAKAAQNLLSMPWFHLLAVAIILLLYQTWRLYYYDSFFPNTFYAKSAYDPYPFQGLLYVGLFYKSYWYLAVLLLLSCLLSWRYCISHRWWTLILILALWHAYVIWVGGDFMFARFLIPILPVMAFSIAWPIAFALSSHATKVSIADFSGSENSGHPGQSEQNSESAPRPGIPLPGSHGHSPVARISFLNPGRYILLSIVIFIILPALRMDPYERLREQKKAPEIQGIVEERFYYPRSKMQELAALARSYSSTIRENQIRLAFHGGAAFLIYYLDPEYALEASTGLTDRKLARRILASRGRIGHEKEATLEYMQERKIDIYMWPPDSNRKSSTIRFQGFWQDWQIIELDSDRLKSLLAHPTISMPYSN